jgi:hypothetical protein
MRKIISLKEAFCMKQIGVIRALGLSIESVKGGFFHVGNFAAF